MRTRVERTSKRPTVRSQHHVPDVARPSRIDGPSGPSARTASRAAAGHSFADVQVFPSGGPGVIQRFGKKKPPPAPAPAPLTDANLAKYERGEGGTANRVDKVAYNENIADSGTNKGFFKPDTATLDNLPQAAFGVRIGQGANDEELAPKMAERAVLSSRLDQRLGTNVLAREVMAEHNGEKGSSSAAVPGRPLLSNSFENWVDDEGQEDASQHSAQYKKNPETGRYYAMSAQEFARVNLKDPRIQKGLADLQLMDALTGQMDRHAGNIFVDDKTGSVKGIDNDIAFGRAYSDPNEAKGLDHNLGLPSQIDAETAERFLKMSESELDNLLTGDDPSNPWLTKEERDAAKSRLRAIQTHIKALKKEKKLVTEWNDTTYADAISAPVTTDFKKNPIYNSYLQRHHAKLATATGIQYAEGNAKPAPVPPPAPLVKDPQMTAVMNSYNKGRENGLYAPNDMMGSSDPSMVALMSSYETNTQQGLYAPNSNLPSSEDAHRQEAQQKRYGIQIPVNDEVKLPGAMPRPKGEAARERRRGEIEEQKQLMARMGPAMKRKLANA